MTAAELTCGEAVSAKPPYLFGRFKNLCLARCQAGKDRTQAVSRRVVGPRTSRGGHRMHSCYVPLNASTSDALWNNDTTRRVDAGNAAALLDMDANRLASCLCRWIEYPCNEPRTDDGWDTLN